MALPEPKTGLVLRYAYLWSHEAAKGQVEGGKDRPCALIARVDRGEGDAPHVMVIPVTHTPPSDAQDAVEIPEPTRRRLGLDDERCWVVVTEYNQFEWPGPDLRPSGGNEFEFGFLPPKLFDTIRSTIIARARAKRLQRTLRDE